jgi:NAD+ diphosphatase
MTDGPPLSRARYDRAALHRNDSDWLASAWTTGRIVAMSRASTAPTVRAPDGSVHLAYRSAESVAEVSARRFLGVANDVAYFSATVEPDGFDEWMSLREFGAHADDLEAGLLVSAIALEQWHQRHTHCPLCGSPTAESQAGWTRTCTADGSEHFPRTDPAVIMLVQDGEDRVLLGRGRDWAEGRFSTLAGFVEPGESLEAAVAREVLEEVGITITDIRYVASQPWPFPASLMLGFTARLDGDPSLRLDPVEIAEAGWFGRAEVEQARAWTDAAATPDRATRLRGISPHLSISRFLIDRWLARVA